MEPIATVWLENPETPLALFVYILSLAVIPSKSLEKCAVTSSTNRSQAIDRTESDDSRGVVQRDGSLRSFDVTALLRSTNRYSVRVRTMSQILVVEFIQYDVVPVLNRCSDRQQLNIDPIFIRRQFSFL